jgi:glycosyltransferase involved in cell wall biosynthesis
MLLAPDSPLDQGDVQSHEVILVDGGSRDRTAEIAEQLGVRVRNPGDAELEP